MFCHLLVTEKYTSVIQSGENNVTVFLSRHLRFSNGVKYQIRIVNDELSRHTRVFWSWELVSLPHRQEFQFWKCSNFEFNKVGTELDQILPNLLDGGSRSDFNHVDTPTFGLRHDFSSVYKHVNWSIFNIEILGIYK